MSDVFETFVTIYSRSPEIPTGAVTFSLYSRNEMYLHKTIKVDIIRDVSMLLSI